jgi:hypothetical protein
MTLTNSHSPVSRAALAIALCCTAAAAFAQDAPAGDPAAEAAATEAAPVPAGPRTYTPEDLARFAPRTALDMVQRVPGFTIRDAPQERGLGQASANVLLNGRRIGGKSDDVASQLGRIPAQNVVRIEIRDGATLDVPGLSGEVANVITRSSRMTGQFSWRPEFRIHHTDPLFTRFDVSVSGTEGPVEYTLGLENQSNHSGAGGRTQIHGADRRFLELRNDVWTNNAEAPRISGRFAVDGPGSSVGNLNFSYRRYWIDYDEAGRRTSPDRAERIRTVVQDIHGYDYEIGGDFEFALGPGRLKLIGLNRFDHEPLVQTVIVDPADSAPSTGDRFARVADTTERIGRGEYRWRGGGADWQISGEAAFNSLASVSELFVLGPSGEFDEVPLPFGSGRVEEDRYELMGSYGRPIGSELTMQLSAGAEYSQLRQVSAGGLTRSFWRPKGQAAFAWRPDPRWNVNLRLQRRVGQLNFLDFLQSVNLNEERENAGNPDLVPPQSWEADLEAIRNLGRYGTTTLRLYGRWYDDIVDIVPIGTDGESPGNIDHALLYGVEWKTTLNMDPLGWAGARFDARLQLQRSRVDDPLTGEPREISGALLRAMSLSLRHDIPGSDWAWGGALDHGFSALNYRLTEVGRQWEGPVWGNLYVEHKDVMGLTVRATVGNVLGARSMWARTVYEGRRTGPVAYFEDRNRTIGPIFSFSVRGRF